MPTTRRGFAIPAIAISIPRWGAGCNPDPLRIAERTKPVLSFDGSPTTGIDPLGLTTGTPAPDGRDFQPTRRGPRRR
jgi:hypothetical protein